MTFKQRLFTILLGLLFAMVLTDQASALYDPGVGRFCSRDPIGYAGSSRLPYGFLDSNPGASVDPTGNITVNLQLAWGSCKLGGNASFYVSAEWRPNRRLATPQAPCDGYLLEKVTASCSGRNCPCDNGPRSPNGSATWISAYPFSQGDSFYKKTADYPVAKRKGCGYYGFNVEFRYICTEDLQNPIENSPGWGKISENDPDVKNWCFKPKGELVRKLGNGMTDPVLTVRNAPGENTGTANAEFNFCCCDRPNDYYLVGYSASDDKSGGMKGDFR